MLTACCNSEYTGSTPAGQPLCLCLFTAAQCGINRLCHGLTCCICLHMLLLSPVPVHISIWLGAAGSHSAVQPAKLPLPLISCCCCCWTAAPEQLCRQLDCCLGCWGQHAHVVLLLPLFECLGTQVPMLLVLYSWNAGLQLPVQAPPISTGHTSLPVSRDN